MLPYMRRQQPRRRDIILRLPWRVRRKYMAHRPKTKENMKKSLSLSPTWKRAFEAEMDALSSHSSNPEGPEDPGDPNGNSIEEIRAWCAQYKRNQRRVRIERQRAGIAGMYDIMLRSFILHAPMQCLQPSAIWRHARLLHRPLR